MTHDDWIAILILAIWGAASVGLIVAFKKWDKEPGIGA